MNSKAHNEIPMNRPGLHHRHGTRRKHSGFTMIEVLIALIVLSVGLLGLAGLQSAGLRFNQSAAMRSQATQLAYDMADRMRSNVVASDAGDYLGAAGLTASCHTTTGCTPAEMAADDLAQWNQAIQRYLPGGAGLICRDATPNDGTGPGAPACDGNATSPLSIKLWWDDDRDGNLDQVPFAMAFEP